MAIINTNFFILFFSVVFLIIGVIFFLHHRSGTYIFLLLLPVSALYFLSTYYLLPLPLNMEGLLSVYHVKTAFQFIPFQSAITAMQNQGILTYLTDILPLISAALLIGCGLPFYSRSKHWLPNTLWCLPFLVFFILIQLLFRLFTGYEGRPIDITDVCLFLVFQSLGYLLYLYIHRQFPEFEKNVHLRRNDIFSPQD